MGLYPPMLAGLGARTTGYTREHRIQTLWLTVNKNNAHAIAWYSRKGFQNAGPTIQEIGGGFVVDDYRMQKNIVQRSRETDTLPRAFHG